MLAEHILVKRGIRSDALWAHAPFANDTLWRIPLALDTRALCESQYWHRERLERLRDERLADLLQFAPRIPFWRERFLAYGIPTPTTTSDCARLPLLSRKDFQNVNQAVYTDAARLASSTTDFTSGSTGTPFKFFFDRGAILRSYAMNERHFLSVGGGTRYPVVSLRARPKIGFALRGHHHFYVRGAFGVRERADELARFMSTLPDGCILYSFPSLLMELGHFVTEKQLRLPIRAIISSGESMHSADRRAIESTLGARVSNCYGTRELGALGFECGENRIHLNEEWAHFEIVDDDDSAAPAGTEGRIVVSTFDNRVMPFIRYDTGDRGTISDERCPCGRSLMTVSLSGRQSDRIELVDGVTVSLLDITPIFDAFFDAISAYQIVQRSPVSFVVRVIPGPRFSERSGDLRFQLIHALHSRASVEWESVESISPSATGKAVYFVRE